MKYLFLQDNFKPFSLLCEKKAAMIDLNNSEYGNITNLLEKTLYLDFDLFAFWNKNDSISEEEYQ